jgi:hypothetical protein
MRNRHVLVLPIALLLVVYAVMLAIEPPASRISVVSILTIGLAHLLLVYGIAVQTLARFKMLYDGLPGLEERVRKIETIPGIRRALLKQESERMGGMETPLPVKEPKFNP